MNLTYMSPLVINATDDVNDTQRFTNDTLMSSSGDNMFVDPLDDTMAFWTATIHVMYKVAGPLILILGSFGNVMTIVVLRKMLSDASAFPLMFTALAVTDLSLLYAWLLPRWMLSQFDIRIFDSSRALCKLLTWLVNTTQTLAAWLLAAITSQRAMSIVWHIRMRSANPRKQALVIIAVLVTVTFGISTYTLFAQDIDEVGQCIWSDSNALRVYAWLLLALNCALPSITMVMCNCLMIRAMMKSTRRARGRFGQQNSGLQEYTPSRVTLTLILVSVVFIVLTLPYQILYILYQERAVDDHPSGQFLFWMYFADLLWATNNAVNFFLYILTGTKFREEAKNTLCNFMSFFIGTRRLTHLSSEQTELTDF